MHCWDFSSFKPKWACLLADGTPLRKSNNKTPFSVFSELPSLPKWSSSEGLLLSNDGICESAVYTKNQKSRFSPVKYNWTENEEKVAKLEESEENAYTHRVTQASVSNEALKDKKLVKQEDTKENEFMTWETRANISNEPLNIPYLLDSRKGVSVGRDLSESIEKEGPLNLISAIFMFLTEERISENKFNSLNELQKVYFMKLVTRKCGVETVNPTEFCTDPSFGHLQKTFLRNRINKPRKRVEENKKFIFKSVMKKLLGNGSKKADQMLSYYFGETAEQTGIPIREFFDPLRKQSGTTRFKTLSLKYFHLIFQCVKFKTDFEEYLLSNEFEMDHRRVLESKTRNLVLRFEQLSQNVKDGRQLDAKFAVAFRFSVQSKFPWTFDELQVAREGFRSYLNLEVIEQKIRYFRLDK